MIKLRLTANMTVKQDYHIYSAIVYFCPERYDSFHSCD